MHRKIISITITMGALLLPALTYTTTANAFVLSEDPASLAELHLIGRNGYSVSVSANRHRVTLTANGFSGEASYTVPGRVSTRGIWARFGSRGRIAVRFRPSGSLTRRVPSSSCEGRPRVTRLGTFVGTIRFRGEHGYIEIDDERARGYTHAPRRWRCRPRHGRGGRPCRSAEGGPEEMVALGAANPRQRRSFYAIAARSPEESGSTVFFASTFERRGRMRISRFAFVNGPERTFTYDSGLAAATVTPPSPFQGTATFQRNPDRTTSWMGTLHVSLPGAPNLALTGSAFDAHLIHPVIEGQATVCIG